VGGGGGGGEKVERKAITLATLQCSWHCCQQPTQFSYEYDFTLSCKYHFKYALSHPRILILLSTNDRSSMHQLSYGMVKGLQSLNLISAVDGSWHHPRACTKKCHVSWPVFGLTKLHLRHSKTYFRCRKLTKRSVDALVQSLLK